MRSELGHSPLRELWVRFMLRVCLLYCRLRRPSTAPGKRKMGNSLKSTPPPLERPLPGTEGKSEKRLTRSRSSPRESLDNGRQRCLLKLCRGDWLSSVPVPHVVAQIFNDKHLKGSDTWQFESVVILRENPEIGEFCPFILRSAKPSLMKATQVVSLTAHRDPPQDHLILKTKLLVIMLACP